MSKRYDPDKKQVKEYLFIRYGTYCMCCGKKLRKGELFLHHLLKWEHSHKTTKEESGLVCDCCHKRIHQFELCNEEEYSYLNNSIRHYKLTH